MQDKKGFKKIMNSQAMTIKKWQSTYFICTTQTPIDTSIMCHQKYTVIVTFSIQLEESKERNCIRPNFDINLRIKLWYIRMLPKFFWYFIFCKRKWFCQISLETSHKTEVIAQRKENTFVTKVLEDMPVK